MKKTIFAFIFLVRLFDLHNVWSMDSVLNRAEFTTVDGVRLIEACPTQKILSGLKTYKAHICSQNVQLDSYPKPEDIFEAILVKKDSSSDITGVVVKQRNQTLDGQKNIVYCLVYYPVKHFYEAIMEEVAPSQSNKSDENGWRFIDIIEKTKDKENMLLRLADAPDYTHKFYVKIVKEFSLQETRDYSYKYLIVGTVSVCLLAGLIYYFRANLF